ncbi:hypothetical protein [Paracoccus alkanivorans]|uniref:Uncharacterized protein n=1 Tax=Paracoccus alkanivorans TaxID=2116655 RepID=A0A3M0MIL8_9RHOB|nr:hypothetical protein [Paracoccus alkanivorans]RMC37488.1 hypothetical protein C9E81_01685 [Paracoccus alkanivorans]
MSVQLINEILRDFERYTGDGKPNEPVGHPLPIGDPRSGTHDPAKYRLRELLLSILQSMGDPQALQDILDQLAQKADLANAVKYFGSRAGAESAGQAALPASYGTIMTGEGGVVALRGAAVEDDDPLFATAPFWGVLIRIPVAEFVAQQIGLIHLENVEGTPDAITASMSPVLGAIQADTIFGFSPIGTNSAPDPTVTVNGVTVTLKDPDGSALPVGVLDNSEYYIWRVNTALEARLLSRPIGFNEWIEAINAVPSFEAVAGGETVADINLLQNELIEDGPPQERGSVDDLSLVASATSAGSGNIAISTPLTGEHVTDVLKIFAPVADTLFVRSWTSPDAINFTRHAEQAIEVAAGYGEYPVAISVPSGGYVGAQSSGGAIGINASGTAFSFYAGQGDAGFTDSNGTGSNSYTFTITLKSRRLKAGAAANTTFLTSVWMLGLMGQSNAVGAPATTPVTTRQRYGAIGFDNKGTLLAPLTVAGTSTVNNSEWPGMGLAHALRDSIMFAGGTSPTNVTEGMIIGHSAKGGTPIAQLGPGSAEYNGALEQITAAGNYCISIGATLNYLGSGWIQGENDIVAATPEETYEAALINIAESHDADARAALSALGFDAGRKYPLFVVQTTSGLPYAPTAEAAWAIPKAQLDASDQSPLVQVACPMYMAPFVQYNHVDGWGSRLLGAYIARAAYFWRTFDVAYSPLRAVDWWTEGNDILIAYSRDGLVLDALWQVPQQAQEGFTVYDDLGSEVPIVSVTASGNEVRLTLGTAPAPDWRWTYGEKAATGLLPYGGGAGNLRDSAGDYRSFDGVPLHNAALMQGGVV